MICERISTGELIIDICDEAGMPSSSAFYRWMEITPSFRETFARARLMQAHAAAETAVRSGRAATAENAAAARVKFDADRWFASKIAPRDYGDRIAQEHSGPNGGPIQVEDTRAPITDLLKPPT